MTAPPLIEAARELLDYLDVLDRPGCLIGGMVVARWGEPRATQDTWHLPPDVSLTTCSAEDLIGYKLVAGRPGDLVDVHGIVTHQGRRLDADRVRRWGRIFADVKEDPGLLDPFENSISAR